MQDFGKIVNRVDMPNVGDEVHHYGYSSRPAAAAGARASSPSRMHVFDVKGNGKRLALRAVNDQLAATSGYVVPHGVMAMSTRPGDGDDDRRGQRQHAARRDRRDRRQDRRVRRPLRPRPGPRRRRVRPRSTCTTSRRCAGSNRGISTTFGPPALCAGGIDPTCLGDEVSRLGRAPGER